MALSGYDVKKKIEYDSSKGHYQYNYTVHFPPYKIAGFWAGGIYYNYIHYDGSVAVDGDSNFTEDTTMVCTTDGSSPTDLTYQHSSNGTVSEYAYFANPYRDMVNFTSSNCYCKAEYTEKATFSCTIPSSGWFGRTSQSLTVASVYCDTTSQYSFSKIIVKYKKTTDSSYSEATATFSGTWSSTKAVFEVTLEKDTSYNVYVIATSDDGSTATSNVGTYSTVDATAVATCVSPSGSTVSKNVTFTWSHSTAYGSPQYAYDVQYKGSSGTSWTVVSDHVIGSEKTASAVIEDAGIYDWRVRTYNQSDVAGAWASATFINQTPAAPPTNVSATTGGRPTVTWSATSQSAYQVIAENKSGTVVYDSGAIYLSSQKHFINQYFDSAVYTIKVRIYNQLGEVSDYASTDYQQPAIDQVDYDVEQNDTGGAKITIIENSAFTKYYLRRNGKTVKDLGTALQSTDRYAVGQTEYELVGVTEADQSSIAVKDIILLYPNATILPLSGSPIHVNRRVNNAFEVNTSINADVDTETYLGATKPYHYPSKLRAKSWGISFFDASNIAESLLATIVFYADNFGNGGWCMVTKYAKSDSFDKDYAGESANETQLTLEETAYDDSIEYTV